MLRPNPSIRKAIPRPAPTVTVMHEGEHVLPRRRTVLLDAVDPVEAALHLAHRGRRRDQEADQPDRQQEESILVPAAIRLPDRLREHVARRSWNRAPDRLDDRRRDPGVAERGREPDQDDDRLDQDEGRRKGERPGVARAVRLAESRKGAREQVQTAGPGEGLFRVVARASQVSGTRAAVLTTPPGRPRRWPPARSSP